MGLRAPRHPAGCDLDVNDFAWPAVMEGFTRMNTMSYPDAHAELQRSPDGIAARILGKSIDYSRHAQLVANHLAASAGGR